MAPNAAPLTRPLEQTRVTLAIKTHWIAAGLFLCTLLLYLPSLRNDFINFDDPGYITDNPHVLTGLTAGNSIWAFTTFWQCNWHPLTWLSHQFDCQLFAGRPAGPHFVSALFHAANAMLLFFFLLGATDRRWPSTICAALFAWHPLRVESVAWAAERKDVLCAFFFFLTLLCYVRYARRSRAPRLAAAIAFYALGLMAKPMIVTLPCLLVLLDFWPLRRWSKLTRPRILVLCLEKIPFLVMAIASSIVTYEAQKTGGAVMEEGFAFPLRIANACVSYARYLREIFLPINLAVFYPLPSRWPVWGIASSGILLTVVTAIAVWQTRRRPFLIVGWLWFCGMLVPAIGLVQVGSQSIGDRYTYLPSIGISIAICWMGEELARRRSLNERQLALAAGGILVVLAAMTVGQISYWHDDYSLFLHADNAVDKNWVAQGHIADALAKQQDYEGAEAHFRQELEWHPTKRGVKEALGDILAKNGEFEKALQYYDMELQVDSNNPRVHGKLGNLLLQDNRFNEAAEHYKLYLSANPNDAEAHNNLAVASAAAHDYAGATMELEKSIQLDPTSASAECSLAGLLAARGDLHGAVAHYQRSLALDPKLDRARSGLADVQAHIQQRHW